MSGKLHVWFCPDYRKTVTYQADLARALSAQGCGVHFISLSRKRVTFFFKAMLSRNREKALIHFHWPECFWRQSNLLVYGMSAIIFVFALVGLKIMNVPIVWTVHNLEPHDRKYQALDRQLSRFLSQCSDKLIVHYVDHKKVVRDFFGVHEKKIEVIPYAWRLQGFISAEEIKEAKRQLGVLSGKLFLCFGQIRPYKHLESLIEAWQRVDHKGDTSLIIVGCSMDSQYAEKIRNLCANDASIEFRDFFVPDKDVRLYYAAADVIVLSYNKVFTSGALMQAKAFEKLTIAPDLDIFKQELGDRGIFYEMKNVSSMTDALAQGILPDRSPLTSAPIIKKTQYSWRNSALQTHSLYKNLKS